MLRGLSRSLLKPLALFALPGGRWVCTALGVAAAIGTACGVSDTEYFGVVPSRPAAGHLRYCNQADAESLDPAIASTTVSSKLVFALFDGLAVFGHDGLPRPSLATQWDVSPDLRRYTFHLRSDAKWSNGRAVDGYDAAYQVLRVLSAESASPHAQTIAPIKNATEFFAKRIARLNVDAPPYRRGDLVEIIDDAPPDINLRVAQAPLQLRDLGAAPSASYVTVPTGEQVTVIATSGMAATRPSPDGVAWSYVYWASGEGYFGWVPSREVEALPRQLRQVQLRVRAVPRKRLPGVELEAAAAAATAPAPAPGSAPGSAPVAAPASVTASGSGSASVAAPATAETISVAASALFRSFDAVGVRVVDAQTIIFETADPSPSFLALATDRAMRPTPSEAVSRDPRHWATPNKIVSSGPLALRTWRNRDVIELVRAPHYRDQAEILLDRVTVYALDDQAAATNYYYTGGCDALATNQPPSTMLPVLSGERRGGRPYADYYVRPYAGVYFAWINTKVVTNRHLRRALAYAVDRSQIPAFTHGNEIPSAQFTFGTPIASLSEADRRLCRVGDQHNGVAAIMEPGKLCYTPPPGLDYDLAKAKAELALAKRQMGSSFPAKLEYRYNAGSEAHKQIAEFLQHSWQAIGIDVELASQEWKSFVTDTRQGNYQIARFGSIASSLDTETEFLPLLRCDSPDNRGKYCNPAYEELFAKAQTIADRDARNVALREAERVAIEDAPLIPLYVYTQKQMQKPYVRNLAINAIDQPALHRVWIDTAWRPGMPVPAPPSNVEPEVLPPNVGGQR